jgi:hypothetical protein
MVPVAQVAQTFDLPRRRKCHALEESKIPWWRVHGHEANEVQTQLLDHSAGGDVQMLAGKHEADARGEGLSKGIYRDFISRLVWNPEAGTRTASKGNNSEIERALLTYQMKDICTYIVMLDKQPI